MTVTVNGSRQDAGGPRGCRHERFRASCEVRANGGEESKVVRVTVKCEVCGTPVLFPEGRYVCVESVGLVAVLEGVVRGD